MSLYGAVQLGVTNKESKGQKGTYLHALPPIIHHTILFTEVLKMERQRGTAKVYSMAYIL